MPSFTLLGPQIIRFPFILSSSYPHEILHNWWGNSVFVDYASGNWCEGLTAYMADHLIQEQRGQGEEYRRDTLQKYRELRAATGATSRSPSSARATARRPRRSGYGKTLMVFHMLRQRIGRRGLPQVGGALLPRVPRASRPRSPTCGSRSRRWPGRTSAASSPTTSRSPGAAAAAGDARATCASRRAAASRSPFVIEQTQAGRAAAARRAGRRADRSGSPRPPTVRLEAGLAASTVRTDGASRWPCTSIPSFDVFRLLDPRETPASIGQIFGEPRILAVLPVAGARGGAGRLPRS